jgi:cytidylate kinase
VYLKVDLKVAAQRVLADRARAGESYASLEEAMQALQKRRESELLRFQQLYGLDCRDMSHYDLVVDTSAVTPEAVCQTILDALL